MYSPTANFTTSKQTQGMEQLVDYRDGDENRVEH